MPLLRRKTTNWDRVAESYDKLVDETGDFNHKTYINPVILEIIGNFKNKQVLDVGCGQGYFCKILANKGARVTGIDISKKLIDIANERFDHPNIEFLVKDASDMEGIKKNQFETVLCNMSFHDIEDIDKTIDEIARVIQISGKLIFSIPHPWTHLGKTLKKGREYQLLLKNYKTQLEVPNKLYGDKGIVSYHRPLQYYIEKLTEHSFEITNFVEISKEHSKGKKINDKNYLRFKQEFPSFLVIGATKRLVVE